MTGDAQCALTSMSKYLGLNLAVKKESVCITNFTVLIILIP